MIQTKRNMERAHPGRVFCVGLTGGIGAGKSTVARYLAALGAYIVDADVLARQAVAPGSAALRKIKKLFGAQVVMQGQLDRGALAALVFGSETRRKQLEQIIHPEVRRLFLRERRAYIERCGGSGGIIIYVAPLLFESKSPVPFLRCTIAVLADRENSLRRAMLRDGCSRAAALRRYRAQMSPRLKAQRADLVIYNNGSLAVLRRAVGSVWRELLVRAGRLQKSTIAR